MDNSLFLLILFVGFGAFAAVVYCLLSTCLGLEIRRSDIWQAFNPFTSASAIAASQQRRRSRTAAASAYELDDMTHPYDRLAGGMGGDDMEMMRRGGPGAKYY